MQTGFCQGDKIVNNLHFKHFWYESSSI